MDKKIYVSLLCLSLICGILAETYEPSWEESDLQELIDIDENKGMYEGSGNNVMNDDDEMGDYSGFDPYGTNDMEDDGDEEEMGSAEMESAMTDCWRVKMQVSRMENKPYVPKCTDDGLFEVVQCHSNYEECFCVDTYGRKIIGTSKYNPSSETRRTMCDKQYLEIEVEKPDIRKGVKAAPPSEEVDIEPIEYPDQDLEFTKNTIDNMNGGSVDIETLEGDNNNEETNDVGKMMEATGQEYQSNGLVMSQPGILAAIIGGTVVGLLCAVLLVMFIVYRMRKKDEGSYALDEPKRSPSHHQYQRASNREFYA